jgi:hypothetical protein
MNYLLLLAGLLIIILTMVDLAWTSLSLEGGGWLTKRLTKGLWRMARFITKRNARSILLSAMGFISMFTILILWVGLIWAGNLLVYISDNENIVDQYHVFHHTFADKFYFTGFVLSTMGLGDLVPVQGSWQIYTAIASFSGLIVITVAITYFVPVLNALVHERSLAQKIHVIGANPQQFLISAYNGKDFSNLNEELNALNNQLLTHIQHQKAYPVLFYFHTNTKEDSLAIQLAVLDEVLSILIHCVPTEKLPQELYLCGLRNTINIYLKTIHKRFLSHEKSAMTDILDTTTHAEELMQIIPEVIKVHSDYEPLKKRRKILGAYLHFDCWSWNEVVRISDEHKNEAF